MERLRAALRSDPVMTSPEDAFAYGEGIPPDATWRNLLPAVELGLGLAPGSGEAMSLQDAWNASGRAGNALLSGDYGQAASDYLNMGTGLLGAIPGAGIVARGTKRGAAWMDRNLPTGFNRLLDAVYPSDPRSTTNIFAGPTAKTADQAALSQAQELAQSGASRDEILQSTGWAKGSDGKWKFEIDDSAARPVMSVNRIAAEQDTNRVYLGRVLDHPQLYEAYPELKTAGVRYEIGQPGASYDEAENMLTLKGPKLTDTQMPRTDVLLHEVQHPIQGKEGFARGGNPGEFADIWGPKADRIRIPMETKLVAEEIGIKDIPWPGDPAYAQLKEAVRASIEDRSGRPFSFRHVSEGMDEFDWDYGSTMNAPKAAIAEQTRLGLRNLGMDQYNRLAGEVEPRNVQTRMNMPAAERRAKGYWETQDVPDDQQIVRFR